MTTELDARVKHAAALHGQGVIALQKNQVSLAAELLGQALSLDLGARLPQRRCSTRRFTCRHLESAFTDIYEGYLADARPQHLFVDSGRLE